MDWKGTLELRNPARCASHAFHECKPKRESAARCAASSHVQAGASSNFSASQLLMILMSMSALENPWPASTHKSTLVKKSGCSGREAQA